MKDHRSASALESLLSKQRRRKECIPAMQNTVRQSVRVPNIGVVSQVIPISATFPKLICVLDRSYSKL